MKSTCDLELMLFENCADQAHKVLPFGISTFLVDWEYSGKVERQNGFDTEIQPAGVDELAAVAAVPGAVTWCRISHHEQERFDDVELAIAAGAHGIFLPMVTNPQQVERFLRRIDGRCDAGILVETSAAVGCVHELATLPINRVYFGLNDFAISRGGGSIFLALLDGSVERAREAFAGRTFGFGGATAIGCGHPVPCARLIEEMARIDCQFSFLRRSYRRDVQQVGVASLTDSLRSYWRHCRERDEAAVRRDRLALELLLREVCNGA
jgi:hypothetical protein